jgi:methylmalonyl-CoA mutase
MLVFICFSFQQSQIMSQSSKEKEKKTLFSDFKATTKTEWRALVEKELDGVDFSRKLVWNTGEGFDVEPMYVRDDIVNLPHLAFYPGEAPFVRGRESMRSGKAWTISQSCYTAEALKANAEAKDALRRGANEIVFHCDRLATMALSGEDALLFAAADGGVAVHSLDDYAELVNGIGAANGSFSVNAGLSSLAVLAMASINGVIPDSLDFDPISHLLTHGSLPVSFDTCMEYAADAIYYCENRGVAPGFLTVSGECFHNAGATTVQEMACTLAAGLEYARAIEAQDISIDELSWFLRFRMAVGTNFFMEIAKIRAMRALWAKIMTQMGAYEETAAAMRLHVRTSWRQQTIYDPWVNILRGTVESMAAAIGGADAIYTAPFDEAVTGSNEFSRRIARNTQVILQEEAYLGKTLDAAGGSYYVEQLTHSLATHAWQLFLELQSRGGLLKAAKDGFVQEVIAASAEEKQRRLACRKDILIGTNQHPNPGEKPLPVHQTSREVRESIQSKLAARMAQPREPLNQECDGIMEEIHAMLKAGATMEAVNAHMFSAPVKETLTPLRCFRAAEGFESLRSAVMEAPVKPVVFLATLGPVFWRRARATFASGFFGVAGLNVVDNDGFETAEQAAEAALAESADIVVLCSDDESYPAIVNTIAERLRQSDRRIQLVVAGYPKDELQTLREAGVDEFIHAKADVQATLASILRAFGLAIS